MRKQNTSAPDGNPIKDYVKSILRICNGKQSTRPFRMLSHPTHSCVEILHVSFALCKSFLIWYSYQMAPCKSTANSINPFHQVRLPVLSNISLVTHHLRILRGWISFINNSTSSPHLLLLVGLVPCRTSSLLIFSPFFSLSAVTRKLFLPSYISIIL